MQQKLNDESRSKTFPCLYGCRQGYSTDYCQLAPRSILISSYIYIYIYIYILTHTCIHTCMHTYYMDIIHTTAISSLACINIHTYPNCRTHSYIHTQYSYVASWITSKKAKNLCRKIATTEGLSTLQTTRRAR